MNIIEYQKNAERTCPDLGREEYDQLHMAMGASTEANELLDVYKKWFAYGKEIDLVNVKEEIFDCMWYLVNLCRMLDINLEEGMENNIAKLRKRFPEKFDKEHAINRNLDAERKILEG